MKLNQKPIAVLALALMAATAAFAWDSPEVALVLNQNSDGSYQVNRYDATTGTMLGYYAHSAFQHGAYAPISIQETGNITHVMGYTSQTGDLSDMMYNMSTGQFLGSRVFGSVQSLDLYSAPFGIAWMAGKSGNGAYLFEAKANDGNAYIYDTDLANPQYEAVGAGNVGQVKYDSATGIAAFTNSGVMSSTQSNASSITCVHVDEAGGSLSNVSNYSFDSYTYGSVGSGGTLDWTGSVALQPDGNGDGFPDGVFSRPNDQYNSDGSFGASATYLNSFNPAVSGQKGNTQMTNYSDSAGYQTYVAFGHQNDLYDLETDGSAPYLDKFGVNGLNVNFQGGNALSGIGTPWDMVIYAAPEPSAILGFAPLVLGLIWKRRSKK